MIAKRTLIVAGACGAALLLSVGARFHWRMVAERNETLSALRHEAELLQGLTASLPPAPKPNPAVEKVVARDDDGSSLLLRIASALNNLAVQERSLTTGDSIVRGGVREVPLSLEFKGSFRSAFDLLRQFNESEDVVRVKRLQITKGGDAEDGALSVSLRLTAYSPGNSEVAP